MANSLVSKVEITVSCRKLMDKDLLSKSDPIVALFIKHGTDKFQEFGRTEMIRNNLNPDFSKSFFLDYYFEEVQRLKFKVYDVDSTSSYLDDHDFLGEFECNLGELVSRSNIEARLRGRGITQGLILLRCSEVGSCKEVFRFNFSASNLPKQGWIFGSCKPLLEIYRCNQQVQFTGEPIRNPHKLNFILAHRTEYLNNSTCPIWKTFEIRNWRLCSGDRDWLLRIDCLHKVQNGKDHLFGSFFTSANDLVNHKGQPNYFQLRNFMKSNDKVYGFVSLNSFVVDTEYTFLDYISGGTQLHFTVSVDFTASNGHQAKPQSLHYIHSQAGRLNQYETAIGAVGSIIQDYDYDKCFPGLGFGAKLPPANQVSHCFPMNMCGSLDNRSKCHRVEGLLAAYRKAVRSVTLFGPTNFAPSIRHVQRIAKYVQDGSHYFVLLIITDGIITDMDSTIQAIIDSSSLPMSVIIIGVGDEDFSAMDALDCDNGLLRYGMKVAERDIVQFVPLRDFINLQRSSMTQYDCLANQAKLARSVLAELPDQVSLWMRGRGIEPKTPSHSPVHIDGNSGSGISQAGDDDAVLDYGVPTAPIPTSHPPYPSSSSPYTVSSGSVSPPYPTPSPIQQLPMAMNPGYPQQQSYMPPELPSPYTYNTRTSRHSLPATSAPYPSHRNMTPVQGNPGGQSKRPRSRASVDHAPSNQYNDPPPPYRA